MIFDELAKKYGINLNKTSPNVVIPPISARQHQTVSNTQKQIEQLLQFTENNKKDKNAK